jgi:hypothetical protein
MIDWINTHGLAFAGLCYLFALATSVMPEIKSNNFWIVWMHNVIQILGANANRLALSNPKLQALTQKKDSVTEDGVTKTHTETAAEIVK